MHTADEIRNTTLKHAKELIKVNIRESRYWLGRGLLAIFALQTADEQTDEHTKWANGIGFSGCDSAFLSSLAIQYEKNQRLSERQWEKCLPLMEKYCGQLARIAHNKTKTPELV